jgi:hypothetical protein
MNELAPTDRDLLLAQYELDIAAVHRRKRARARCLVWLVVTSLAAVGVAALTGEVHALLLLPLCAAAFGGRYHWHSDGIRAKEQHIHTQLVPQLRAHHEDVADIQPSPDPRPYDRRRLASLFCAPSHLAICVTWWVGADLIFTGASWAGGLLLWSLSIPATMSVTWLALYLLGIPESRIYRGRDHASTTAEGTA